MGYIRLDEQPGEVYHYTHRKNLDSILRDGRIRRMGDRECWFCASLEDTLTLMRATVMMEGKPYYKVGGSIGRYPKFVPEDYVILRLPAFAAGTGDVAGAIEGTWTDASAQIKTVVNNVVFPVIDLVLAVFFFAKLGMAYFDYRKHGQFEWTAPAILFACLIFTLTAPTYVWTILGM